MNNDIYNYVLKTCKKIKCKDHIEDVQQEVMLVLIEKQIHTGELTEGLKNYIKGIIWNVSHTFYHKMKPDNVEPIERNSSEGFTGLKTDKREWMELDIDSSSGDEDLKLREMYSDIKKYVFKNYYSRGRDLTRWKVFYLILRGYDYKYIYNRLGIKYSSAIEFNYLCWNEIKEKVKRGGIKVGAFKYYYQKGIRFA